MMKIKRTMLKPRAIKREMNRPRAPPKTQLWVQMHLIITIACGDYNIHLQQGWTIYTNSFCERSTWAVSISEDSASLQKRQAGLSKDRCVRSRSELHASSWLVLQLQPGHRPISLLFKPNGCFGYGSDFDSGALGLALMLALVHNRILSVWISVIWTTTDATLTTGVISMSFVQFMWSKQWCISCVHSSSE